MMLVFKHLHRHVEEVVELPVDVGRCVFKEERDVCDGAVELLAHVLGCFLEGLRKLSEKLDELVLGLFVDASEVLLVGVRLVHIVVVLLVAAVKDCH